ncbi:alpha/beta hydrolase [Labilibaculum sp. DW002]|uniref:Alpha/beta hydrolase n=1 Tax=Paralabilibaculum antarcticum TaxID=2912572 RepID=A0ABT5VUI6_9BACT|nr:alpha/beta hydrolase [Labilibaculum sp. DW002]MDE5419078.1 alpha/beta hydrolase [Labilibaculum sp. DW002]
MRRVLYIAIFLFSSSFMYGQNVSELELLKGFNHKETVVYKMVDGVELNMDIFYPDAAKMKEKNPWMIHVHGGGWAGGSKYKILKPRFLSTLHTLVDSGVVCVSIEYRKAQGSSNAYDAAVDAKDATRFLLKNAEKFKLDKEKYGIWGGSAGGHLSLVTALGSDSDFQGDSHLADISTRYKCVVSYFPFTSCLNPDLRPGSIFEDETRFVRLLGAPLNEKPKLAHLLSPTQLLKETSSPILLIHGDKDKILPISNSLYMMEVAKKKNADVQLLTIKNAGHCFKGSNISPSMEDLNNYSAKYILSHLKD